MISVRLDCTPAILNAVLTPLLDDLPDVAVVDSTNAVPDVVVTSAFPADDDQPDWPKATRRGPTIIALDSQSNTVRVRGDDQKAMRERTLVGTLANLRHVLRELSQADSREIPTA